MADNRLTDDRPATDPHTPATAAARALADERVDHRFKALPRTPRAAPSASWPPNAATSSTAASPPPSSPSPPSPSRTTSR